MVGQPSVFEPRSCFSWAACSQWLSLVGVLLPVHFCQNIYCSYLALELPVVSTETLCVICSQALCPILLQPHLSVTGITTPPPNKSLPLLTLS